MISGIYLYRKDKKHCISDFFLTYRRIDCHDKERFIPELFDFTNA